MPKSNTPTAYLTGLLAGTKAKKAGITMAVLDIGLKTPVHGAKIFAALKGAIDAEINIPADEKAFPKQERLSGKHIEEFASKLSSEELNKKFGEYLKNKIDPKKLSELFEKTKNSIKTKYGENK